MHEAQLGMSYTSMSDEGHYAGYIVEAEEMIQRLYGRGFVVALRDDEKYDIKIVGYSGEPK